MNKQVSIYLEQEVLSASPLELVCFLYQGAMGELREARAALAAGDVAARCEAISKACDFLTELLVSLDRTSGEALATRLQGLYTYAINRLVTANLQKKDEPLAEVLGLLTTLHEGWKQAAESERKNSEPASVPQAALLYAQAGESACHSWSF